MKNHARIYNADCFDVMATFPNGCIDLIVTDPPYGIGYTRHLEWGRGRWQKPIANDNSLEAWIRAASECRRILKPGGHIYMFCGWSNIETTKAAFERSFRLANLIVWAKTHVGRERAGDRYAMRHEFVLFGHNAQRAPLRGVGRGVFMCDSVSPLKRTHPTEKPVSLLAQFIKNSSTPGQIVFDPFMGTGSTGAAATMMGRLFIGCELDAGYCAQAAKKFGARIHAFGMKKSA